MTNKKKQYLEETYPQQCNEYRKIVEDAYQLFLDKGREYSPNNIKAIGILGCFFRLFEKVIRSLNILGWDAFEGKPKDSVKGVKFDGVEQEAQDILNIAIIIVIMLRKKWGK